MSDAARHNAATETRAAGAPGRRAEGDAPDRDGSGHGCAPVRQALLQALRPGDPLADPLELHLASCRGCSVLRGELALLDDLTREQLPALPEGFELALRRRLQVAAPAATARRRPPLTREWALGPRLLATAAALFLLVLGGVWLARRGRDPAAPATHHRLHLALDAARDYDDALFDVVLPPGVRASPATAALIGRGARLTWSSAVQRGSNQIDLPLLAQRAEDGEVRVLVRAGRTVWSGAVHFAAPGALGLRRPAAAAGGLTLAVGLVPQDSSEAQP